MTVDEKFVSDYKSPAYGVRSIPIEDLVSQRTNPNSMSQKSFQALTMSIFNTGYSFPVICSDNADYDPATEGEERPSLIVSDDESAENTYIGDGQKVATQMSDDEISRYFPYRLIDGSHRSMVLRLGAFHFNDEFSHMAEDWKKGENIPDKPNKEMLAYIAWRENFRIPAVILEVDPVKAMSATVLHNSARGSHGLDSTRDIVYNLITVAGMSKEWVSQNLFLDVDSIDRMMQISGLKASMNDIDSADMAWNPEDDESFIRKETAYLNREASKYISDWQLNNPDKAVPDAGSALDIAVELGFDVEKAKECKHSASQYAPNGAPRERGLNQGVEV